MHPQFLMHFLYQCVYKKLPQFNILDLLREVTCLVLQALVKALRRTQVCVEIVVGASKGRHIVKGVLSILKGAMPTV